MEEMQGIVGNNPCPAVERLEFEHFESDRHGWRKCERIAGAILAQLIPPTTIRDSLGFYPALRHRFH
jgi:hypothetical protein